MKAQVRTSVFLLLVVKSFADSQSNILTGSNGYSGRTTVAEGALEAGAASVMAGTSDVSIFAGATLRLSGSGGRIKNTAPFLFLGGALETGGLSETVGSVTLAGTATIDLGNGASVLRFADSSALLWSGALNITNWSAPLAAGERTNFTSAQPQGR
jgi:hypothetical protein